MFTRQPRATSTSYVLFDQSSLRVRGGRLATIAKVNGTRGKRLRSHEFEYAAGARARLDPERDLQFGAGAALHLADIILVVARNLHREDVGHEPCVLGLDGGVLVAEANYRAVEDRAVAVENDLRTQQRASCANRR